MGLGAEALHIAMMGYLIFPVEPRGTLPIEENWQKIATCDPQIVLSWWYKYPDTNIGLLTGERAGADVIDVDVYRGGLLDLDEIEGQTNLCPDKLYVRALDGQLHLYIHWADAEKLKAALKELPETIRILGEGGYVLSPPSVDKRGNQVQWANEFMIR